VALLAHGVYVLLAQLYSATWSSSNGCHINALKIYAEANLRLNHLAIPMKMRGTARILVLLACLNLNGGTPGLSLE